MNEAVHPINEVGEFVRESMDLAERGLLEQAFAPACRALHETARKAFEAGELGSPDHQTFIRQNWHLISFIGIPRGSVMPANLPFRLRRAVPSFNVPDMFQEIVVFAVRQTLITSRIPIEIGFNRVGGIEVVEDKLLFPKSVIFALLESAIFHPLNGDQIVSDKYWINIWDFKMFVSELWGREDLARRIMKLYLDQ